MGNFITGNQFEAQVELIPAQQAKDMKVVLILLSFMMFMAAMLGFIFDSWQNGVFLMMQALWLQMLYLCVDKR